MRVKWSTASPVSCTELGTCASSRLYCWHIFASYFFSPPCLSASPYLHPLSCQNRRYLWRQGSAGEGTRKIGSFFLVVVFQNLCILRGTKERKISWGGFSPFYNPKQNTTKTKQTRKDIFSLRYKDNNGKAIGFPGWRRQQTGSWTISQIPSALACCECVTIYMAKKL